MKKRTLISLATLAAVLTSVFILTQGCEDDADTGGTTLDDYFKNNPYVSDPRDSSSSVSIDPENVAITAAGEKLLFTARGGNGSYTWNVANANGTVVAQAGNDDQAIYTVVGLQENNVIVYDGNGEAAVADITYSTTTLSISPSGYDMSNVGGETAIFTASGGVPPYNWSMGIVGLEDDGVIAESGTGDRTGTYVVKAGMTGTNAVYVTDALFDTASATVIQK